MARRFGNVLGDPRAELDNGMLEKNFVETADYLALTNETGYNFIVGRRGTGKSALYIKTHDYFCRANGCFVFKTTPEEFESLALQESISKLTNKYDSARAILKVAWSLSFLFEVADCLSNYYKAKKSRNYGGLANYVKIHKQLIADTPTRRVLRFVKAAQQADSINEAPMFLVGEYKLQWLLTTVEEMLRDVKKRAIILIDKLDEGWTPEIIPAAIVGGLTQAASYLSESNSEIHVYAYIRDNIFRVLSRLDRDFSRNIESSALRLKWDKESLFDLTTRRIAKALDLDFTNSRKIWNRFAHRGLENIAGFEKCLAHTLYRPRDIISLLNVALSNSQRSGRHELIESDIEEASREISENRLQDLVKEYERVLPSLEKLVKGFQSSEAVFSFQEALEQTNNFIKTTNFKSPSDSDFGVFDTPQELFKALYSVGFLGVESHSENTFKFSFDGNPFQLQDLTAKSKVCIHPCYWPALAVSSAENYQEHFLRVHDDYEQVESIEVEKDKSKIIGQLVDRLPSMELGAKGASEFEEWCHRIIKIVFSGALSNPEMHPNKNSVQRRDIIATNCAESGFWKRILDDYNSRQIVFEVKNIEELSLSYYRQALSYSGNMYGKFIIIIHRGKEGVQEKERGYIQEIYNQHKVLVFSLPASMLNEFVRKVRSKKKDNHAEKKLQKRLDDYHRRYLSIRS